MAPSIETASPGVRHSPAVVSSPVIWWTQTPRPAGTSMLSVFACSELPEGNLGVLADRHRAVAGLGAKSRVSASGRAASPSGRSE